MHKWNRIDMDQALYTEIELQKLHRSFGHPSSTALANLLRKARPEEMYTSVQHSIKELTEACTTCEYHASRPKRFRLTVGTEELRFNHIVAVDVMYINRRPILHVVDEATHYSSARFLPNASAKEIWRALRRCWIEIYLGAPDFLRIDQGSSFTSAEFQGAATSQGISILEAPVESPSTMSHVERYHHPLRTAYEKLRSSLGSDEKDHDVLQLAVKSVNDTLGPEGLTPTLLVYGIIPRPARKVPALKQIERAKAMEQAMKAFEKVHARRRVQFALKYKGPYGKERIDLESLSPGSPILLFRDHSNRWEGPFPFISIDGDTVVVQLPSGRKIFRSHVV